MGRSVHHVLKVERVSPQTVVLHLNRRDLSFIPGQCFNIGLPRLAINREYSSYSGASESTLQFLIREVEGGELSPHLGRLKPGDPVEVDGAYGLFVLDPEKVHKEKFVFIATGTGIAPFHSFIRSYPNLNYQVIHGTRLLSEAYHKDHYKRGHYIQCVSQEDGGDMRGRVTTYVAEANLPSDATYYLCGNRHMINDVFDILMAKNVSSSKIITEVFF